MHSVGGQYIWPDGKHLHGWGWGWGWGWVWGLVGGLAGRGGCGVGGWMCVSVRSE